jgi:hypothetical protein
MIPRPTGTFYDSIALLSYISFILELFALEHLTL